jgi:hypothetical protein
LALSAKNSREPMVPDLDSLIVLVLR